MTKKWIEDNLINSIGRINSRALKNTGMTTEDVYLIYHEIPKPTCYCGNPLTLLSFSKGYSKHCSSKCSNSSPDVIDKKKQSYIDTYGFESATKSSIVQEKTRLTNIKKYGVEHVLQSDEIRHKGRVSKLKTYGDEHYNNRDKASKSYMRNYGTSHHTRSKIYRDRMVEKGIFISDDRLDDYDLYIRLVWRETNKNNLTVLENYEKRGRVNLSAIKDVDDIYHLDHRYSIKQGFDDNILPIYIGSINNLEMIKWNENLSKKAKCSITIEELFKGL